MAECRQGAVLVITGHVEGTTTNVVRRKLMLTCGLSAGHTGAHRDVVHGETWESQRDNRTTLVRHEDDPGD
jgi:hypothetical protein